MEEVHLADLPVPFPQQSLTRKDAAIRNTECVTGFVNSTTKLYK